MFKNCIYLKYYARNSLYDSIYKFTWAYKLYVPKSTDHIACISLFFKKKGFGLYNNPGNVLTTFHIVELFKGVNQHAAIPLCC